MDTGNSGREGLGARARGGGGGGGPPLPPSCFWARPPRQVVAVRSLPPATAARACVLDLSARALGRLERLSPAARYPAALPQSAVSPASRHLDVSSRLDG